MPTTESVDRADILQEVSEEYRYYGGYHAAHKEVDFLHSPFRAFLTHTDEKKSCVTFVRDGVEQASIVVDEDGTIRLMRV